MKQARAVAIALVATVALGLAFLVGRVVRSDGAVDQVRSSPDVDAVQTRTQTRPVDTSESSSIASTSSVSASIVPIATDDAPLPPHDTPLVDALEELEARARRGERKAACRLAMDGQFCRAHAANVDSVAFFEDSIARQAGTTDADVAWIAQIEHLQHRAKRLCAGLPIGWADDAAWRWMLQAARAGDHFLAAQFVAMPPFDERAFLERPEPWQQYREHAAALIQAAAASGQVEAIWFLQRLHRGGDGLRGMPNAIERDPRLAAVYAIALQSASRGDALTELQRRARRAAGDFEPEQWAAIEAEGREFARRHFSTVTPRDFQEGTFGAVDSRRCE